MIRAAERRAIDLLEDSRLADVVEPDRVVRFAEFCAVGASGIAVDLAVTFSLLGSVHYLLANAAGFVLAVSWNFAGNWLLTYERPAGTLWKQYGSYVGLHVATFGLRAVALALLVEQLGVPPGPATIVGVGVAAVANFVGTEGIFGGSGRLWFDAVAAVNQTAHLVYTSRLRRWLQALGLYGPLFGAYVVLLGHLYRGSERRVEIGEVSASLLMEKPPEVVSVLHTLEKERAALEALLEDVEPDDCLWDVGANLGVYACLVGDVVDEVAAFEPYMPTAGRLEQNLHRNDVDYHLIPVALGAGYQEIELGLERAEVGTQTPAPAATDGRTTVSADQYRGDTVLARCALSAPTVLKIDVEGAEVDVLEGMGLAMAECRLVYCETHGNADAVRDALVPYGFDVRETTHGTQTYLIGERCP